MVPPVGIVGDRRFLDHRIDSHATENPERLRGIYSRILCAGMANTRIYTPREATEEDLLEVHSELHLEMIRQHCVRDDPFSYDRDTYLMEESFYVASLAAGAGIVLADAVMGRAIRSGFAVIRPPGHHAETGRGTGFCLFNNIAVTAARLIRKHGISRILILDFDAHHGNGTQQIFYDTDQVLTISLHQENLFPANSGSPCDLGRGPGLGYNLNIPLNDGFGDAEMSYFFGKVVQEVAESFRPQFILVAAGFDGHEEDTISTLRLTDQGFASTISTICRLAQRLCDDRVLLFLEGGYNTAVLERCIPAAIRIMSIPRLPDPSFKYSERAHRLLRDKLHPLFSPHWHLAS